MTRFGLDSTGPVPVWAHHAVGSTVALRYLSRSTYKVVTRSEHAAYRKAGIDLVLVFEDSGRPDLQGYDGGKADAEFALRQAHDILGTPSQPVCVCFAADYDPAGRPERTDAYYDGVAAVIHRSCAGPYGGIEVVERQANRGFAQLWQTYAWSGGAVDRRVLKQGCYQYSNGHTVGGVGVDFNHLYGADFGQYDRPAPVTPHTVVAPAVNPHYERFHPGTLDCFGKLIAELQTVKEYDRLRVHPLVHVLRLKALEGDLRLLADRIAYVVGAEFAKSAPAQPRNWLGYWRGWRYGQLLARSQGKRVL